MAKQPTPIPDNIAAEVLFTSDSICCVCQERGKPIQIHHIDENPSNNAVENLAVLCFDCHNKTQVRGGFSRQLTASVVTKYRDEWLKTVTLKRDLVLERAVTRQVGDVSISEQIKAEPRIRVRHTQLKDLPVDYINSLPKFKSDLIQQTNKQKSCGSTLDIVQANGDYADSLTGVLVTLANYYSPECFGDQSPQEFFSEIISSRFRLYSALAEPNGPGTGGTIAGIRRGLSRIADIERIIEDMVSGLWEEGYSEYEDWQKRWRSEEI